MNSKEFVKEINDLRLKSGNNWYFYSKNINGKQFGIKGFKCWLQVFDVNGINCSNTMYDKPTKFKEHLKEIFERAMINDL